MSKNIMIVVFAQLVSLVASANTLESVYQKNSILPVGLQKEILIGLSEKCPQGISNFGLKEIRTTAQKSQMNGQDVIFYTTAFESRYYFDGMHPSTTNIEVQSREILAAIPASERYQETTVSGQACE